MVKWLAEQTNVDVNAKSEDGTTALHMAASAFNGRLDVVKCLVEVANAGLDVTDSQGRTAYSRAKTWEIAQYLSQRMAGMGTERNSEAQ